MMILSAILAALSICVLIAIIILFLKDGSGRQ